MLRKWTILLLLLVFAAGASACSKGGASATSSGETGSNGNDTPKENIKLVFWNSNYKTLDSNDKTKKPEDFYIYQAIKRFQQSHPGITIDVQTNNGGPDSFTKFKTASIAKNGPDINTIWSGSYLIAMKQFIEPLNEYLANDPILDDVVGWNTVKENGEGQILGVPAGNDGIIGLFYNKELIAKAGLDFDNNPPKNAEELLAALDKLKASGLQQPLALDPYNFWFQAAYWISQTIGKNGVYDLASGKRSFIDPSIKEVLATYAKFNPYASNDQPTQLFSQGKAAITIGGAWLIGDLKKTVGDKLGMMKLPDFNATVAAPSAGIGQVGSAFFVTNYSKHKKEAAEFLKFLVSKEEQELLLKSGETTLTVNKNLNNAEAVKEPMLQTQQKWSTEPDVLPYLDNTLPAEVSDEITKQAPVLFKGQLSPDDFMKLVDQKLQDSAKK